MARIKNNILIAFSVILFILMSVLIRYSVYFDSNDVSGLVTGTIQVTVKNDEPSFTHISDQIWLVNKTQTIMLYDYFTDPEGIPLSFSHTSISNILVTIDQPTGRVTLTPDSNWVGEVHVIFYASDGPNTKVSNNISLRVVHVMPEPEPLAEQPRSRYISGCFYNWECEAWADCLPEGIQERVCINNGTCPDAYRQPPTSRKCFYKEVIVEQPLPLPEEELESHVPGELVLPPEVEKKTEFDFIFISNMFMLIAIILLLLVIVFWFLADVPDKNAFIANDNQVAKNLKDMRRILLKMNNETFIYHVNEKKNDISYWIKNSVGDKKLASQLEKSKTKTAKSFATIISKRISLIKKCYKTHQIKNPIAPRGGV